jgi:hypothetical protein
VLGMNRMYVPVVVTLVLLAGLATETLSRPRPKDADGYHAAVKRQAEAIPLSMGTWRGVDLKPAPAAVALLRPNVILHRRYTDNRPTDTRPPVDFLFVQCRDARDMQGHYPPVCYPAHGYTKLSDEPAEWRVGDRTIVGMEYAYSRTEDGVPTSCVVSNLLILPTGKYAQGMTEVREAAADYLRQFYGAAQVQVVMDARVAREERDTIVREFLAGILPVLDSISGVAAGGGKQ